ncbi:SIMPL domain-containing protein [Halotalea alkalilenta]|nr:SIMPL domain-containing protein [Halotalea alkalilenta]
MTTTTLSRRLTLGVLCACALALPLAAQAKPATLEVSGEGQVQIVPDRAGLNATLWEKTPLRDEGESAAPGELEQARSALERRMSQLIDTLVAAGVARERIHAGSISIQPEMLYASSDGQPNRSRISVERPIQLDIEQLDRLPTVLEALTQAGVDRLDGVSYDVADRGAVEDRALAAAVARAEGKARAIAASLSLELGPVLEAVEGEAPHFQPRMMAMAESRAADAVDYNPGEIGVEARIILRYALEE